MSTLYNQLDEDTMMSMVRLGDYRLISSKRAREIRKRGDHVWWCCHCESYAWDYSRRLALRPSVRGEI